MYLENLEEGLLRFRHPCIKLKFLMEELNVSRLTATSYLNKLESKGLAVELKFWRENFYLSEKLFNLLISAFHLDIEKIDSIDSNG